NWTTNQFVAAQRAVWVDHFRLHDLRHFMATQMLAAGIPCDRPSVLATRVSTRSKVEAHSVPGGDRRAAETLSAILAAGERAAERSPAPPAAKAGGWDVPALAVPGLRIGVFGPERVGTASARAGSDHASRPRARGSFGPCGPRCPCGR